VSPGSSGSIPPVAVRHGNAKRAIRPRLPNEKLHNVFVRDGLHRFLLDAGASETDIERAAAEGWLPLLTLDRLVSPGASRHDAAGVAALAGCDEDRLRQLWRAVGFPDVPAGLPVFTDADVDAARRLAAGGLGPGTDFATLLRHVRVISSSAARIASVVADDWGDTVRRERAAGADDEAIALGLIERFNGENLAALLVHVTGLQLRAAVWRRMALDAAPDLAVAIGFADLAGYTELSAELEPDRLAAFVGEWEEVAYDTAARHSGRIIKTIGDEAMFAGLSSQVARIALALRDAAHRRGLPEVRAGIAAGLVVARDGDFYGPVVNLASRLTEIAPAGVIYASAALHDELADDDALQWTAEGTRELRSIGPVQVFSLQGTGSVGASS
jgi:adenylate cyclase